MAKKKPKLGRPKSGADVRDAKAIAYLTPSDVAYLDRISRELKFKSRSAFISALLERLCIEGFSVVGFLKLGLQFQKRVKTHGKGMQLEFYAGTLRPLPPFPDDDLAAESIEVIETLKHELEKLC
jgi:hypothetical protein